jgi:hypothetical protein
MVDKHEAVKTGVDIASGLIAVSAVANVFDPILTFIVTILSIIWLSIRIWDHRTVRKATGRDENG